MAMKWTVFLFVWTILVSTTSQQDNQTHCPDKCRCVYSSAIVDCSQVRSSVIPVLPYSTRVLILDNNPLGSLAAGVFNNTSDVKQLSLQNCRLKHINHKAFRGLERLTSLVLSKNLLTELPHDIFSDQVHLENLVLSENQLNLSSIGHAVDGLHNLQLLDIGGNPMDGENLPSQMINLTHLQTLVMLDVDLLYLSDDFFRSFQNVSVSKLVISGVLYNVSRYSLSPLKSLHTLDISNTVMTSFDASSLLIGLNNMTTLRSLNMDNILGKPTTGSIIHKHFFQPLRDTQLRVLYFRGNTHAFNGGLQHKLFKYLPDLIDLYLDACSLTSVHSEAFYGLKQLKFLSLNGNLLSCQDKSSCGFLSEKNHNSFSSLLTLDLSDNNIDIYKHGLSFHGSVFSSLQYLYLSNNKLNRLPTGMFKGLANLKLIDLSRNPITVVDTETFSHLPNLQILWMNQTGVLDNLPAKMCKGCHNLQVLDMSMGDISRINPQAFKGLSNLQYLDLRDNYLYNNGSLTNITIDSPYMWKLDLGENKLTQIPPFVTSLHGLKQLFLDMNYLTDDSLGCLVNNTALEILDISYNSITHICPTFLKSHRKLQKLLMEENPFMCDCDFHSISDDVKQSNVTITRVENHKCVGPPSIKGHNIFTFSPSKWQCGVKDGVIPFICVLITVFLVVVVILVKRSDCEIPQVYIKECCNWDNCYIKLRSKTELTDANDQDTIL